MDSDGFVCYPRVHRNFYLAFIIFGALLLLLITYAFYNSRKARRLLHEKNTIIETKNQEITDSINYALRIQHAFLPPAGFISGLLASHFVLFKPKDIVSGDFYWVEKSGSKTYFAVADCTGHGVPGAFVSLIANSCLSRAVFEFNILQPGEILEKLSDLFSEAFKFNEKKMDINDGLDISICSIEKIANHYEVCFAGAMNSLYIVEEGTLKEIKGDKQPIQANTGSRKYNQHTLTLEPLTRIYLSSDGYQDQIGGPNGKKFKSKVLKEEILLSAGQTMDRQKDHLNKKLSEWMQKHEQVDDISIMGVELV